mgnify:CR=1 FL=1|tara:strand:- start:106 stop:354 length:249 start_codon:yes stop_codon:yes gene_type:complete
MIIKYFAWVKNITKLDEEKIIDDSIVDIDTLKKFLIKKYPKLKKYIIDDNILRIAINLEYNTNNISINKNDEIAIFPPVSGG